MSNFATINNFSGSKPQVFSAPKNAVLLSTSSYGGVGYPSTNKGIPSSYGTLAQSYATAPRTSNARASGNVSIMSAYPQTLYQA